MDKYREKYLIYKKKYINYINTHQIGGGEENKSLLPEWVSNFTGYNLSALKLVSDGIHKQEDQKVQESVQQTTVQQQQPTGPKKVVLNSSDELFYDIRDLNFSAVGIHLSRKAKQISAAFEVSSWPKTYL